MSQRILDNMMKILTVLVLALPVAAQVNPILPQTSVNIGEMTAPPAIRSKAGTRELGQEAGPGRVLYGWSVAAVLTANAADVASSWNALEANRVVAGPGTQFGYTSVAIKSGFVATSLLIQHLALRHRPDLYKKLAWMNFVTSGVLGGVATHNMGVR